ncbi:hypothetical protein PFNF135_04575 [Plasmodium falciparum NF135/5.C10]|uniref:Protein transport protein SEC20 n=1 Tax=Plasmodium falciparum NF135/5.C10 TaxID=1036726 RepID=W4IC08_PLAFA|nr:hypothetical protein PFNF135_04575 [Plasmodium falciparum NF135/5.C10]
MNHNFKRSLDINNKNVDDNINKINSIINQMRLVDENLKSLFSFEETLNDHDALLLFRGRVSKRIVDYSNLITECDNNLTCSEYISPNLKEQYEYHLKNIDKAESDTRYVWYSFFFFVSICVYITMRRLGLLRAMFTLIKLIVSILFYVSKLCFKIFQLFKKTNEAKYTPTVDNSKSLVLVPINNEL